MNTELIIFIVAFICFIIIKVFKLSTTWMLFKTFVLYAASVTCFLAGILIELYYEVEPLEDKYLAFVQVFIMITTNAFFLTTVVPVFLRLTIKLK